MRGLLAPLAVKNGWTLAEAAGNKTPDKMADADKILRAVDRLPKIQMTDDLDKGYLQTMGKWAKRVKDSSK